MCIRDRCNTDAVTDVKLFANKCTVCLVLFCRKRIECSCICMSIITVIEGNKIHDFKHKLESYLLLSLLSLTYKSEHECDYGILLK